MGFLDAFFKPKSTSTPEGWDEFYLRFEDRFRGGESSIKSRLRSRYEIPLRLLSKSIEDRFPPVFIDLGSGRGEFLELCKIWGYQSLGFEQNESMVSQCLKLELDVRQGDILTLLKSVPDSSVTLVACIHVIEHIPAPYFWQVAKEVKRCLKPKGVFIVETPSLYSLWTSARQFYLDPTHTHPIHPEYVKFLMTDTGFSHVEIREFDPVVTPEKSDLATLANSESQESIQKLDKWLYGPMDLCLWAEL